LALAGPPDRIVARSALDTFCRDGLLADPGAGDLEQIRPGLVALRAQRRDAESRRHLRRARRRLPAVSVRLFRVAVGGAAAAPRGRGLLSPDARRPAQHGARAFA